MAVVVDLWPEKAPGDVGIEGEEYFRVYDAKIVGPTRLLTNVSRPTLTVHRPEPGKNTGTALVVCPGGGYHDLFWDLEGEEVAAWAVSVGITAAILKYRVPRRPGESKKKTHLGPQIDAQRAIRLVRANAAAWGVRPDRIGIMGFSVGGHLTMATATGFARKLYDRVDAADDHSSRPDFAVPCYAGFLKADHTDTLWEGLEARPDTPPTFLVHATDDSVATVEHSVIMYLALKRAGVPVEMHVYATGEHDFGVRRNEKQPSGWTDLLLSFLRARGLLTPSG